MIPSGAATRRLCVAADARGYGRGDDFAQLAIQRHLIEVLDSAAISAGLQRPTWDRQAAGDAELAVLPVDEPEAVVVDRFVRELDAALARHNKERLETSRLRLRVAIHFGRLMQGVNGFAGPAPVEVSRLLNSAPLRDALESSPNANLALMVSDVVFTDTIAPQHTTLRPTDFQQVRITEKELRTQAWLWIPAGLPPASGVLEATPPEPGPTLGGQVVTTTVNGSVTGENTLFGIRNG